MTTNIQWQVGPHVRCSLVGYSGVNCTGARYIVQVFPTGSRKGTFRMEELKSLVIVAPVGVRVILCTHDGPDWEDHPWRCIRLTREHRFRNEKGDEGVRVPDLDWMDAADARKANEDLQTSYPYVKTISQGTTWTFGRPGMPLKGNVRAIRLEREG